MTQVLNSKRFFHNLFKFREVIEVRKEVRNCKKRLGNLFHNLFHNLPNLLKNAKGYEKTLIYQVVTGFLTFLTSFLGYTSYMFFKRRS